MEKEIKLFDFKENWGLVKPYLNNPELIGVLNQAMNEHEENWYELRTSEGIDVKKRPTYDYRTGKFPWALCSSTAVMCRACDCTPVDYTYRSFQLFHGCHWIAQWAVKLGELLFPEHEWELYEGEAHTVALGESDSELLILDILLFENNDPVSILDYVEGFAECDIKYAEHKYDKEKNLCTCWGKDEEDIKSYRKQIEEELAQMEECYDYD